MDLDSYSSWKEETDAYVETGNTAKKPEIMLDQNADEIAIRIRVWNSYITCNLQVKML